MSQHPGIIKLQQSPTIIINLVYLQEKSIIMKIIDHFLFLIQILIISRKQNKNSQIFQLFVVLFRILLQSLLFTGTTLYVYIYFCLSFQSFALTNLGFTNKINTLPQLYLIISFFRNQSNQNFITVFELVSLIFIINLSSLTQFIQKPLIRTVSAGNSIQSEFRPKSVEIKSIEPGQKSIRNSNSKSKISPSANAYCELNQGNESKKIDISESQNNIKPTTSLHYQDISQTEDEKLLKEFNWIKGQQFMVFDQEENLIVQTFMLTSLMNNTKSFNQITEQEYLAQILQVPIQIVNKDLYDVFHEDENFLNSADKNNNSSIPYEDQNRFELNQPIQLQDIMKILLSNYEKHRKSYFIIYKLETIMEELLNIYLKLFLVNKNDRSYLFIQFDTGSIVTNSQQKQIINFQKLFNSLYSMLSNGFSTYLNFIITLSQISAHDQKLDDDTYEKYLNPVQRSSIQLYIVLANYRDYNLFLQNKLILRNQFFRITELVEDTINYVKEQAIAKKVQINVEIDMQDQYYNMFTDADRLKQLLWTILKFALKQSIDGIMNITITQSVSSYFQITIKSTGSLIEEKEYRSLIAAMKKYSFSSNSSIVELLQKGMVEEFQMIVAQILARKLAGTCKKGLEVSRNNQYIFYIESNSNLAQLESNQYDSNSVLRMMGQSKYYENSFSQIMGNHFSEQNGDSSQKQLSHSLHFSLSQISKQFSHKQSDHQSAYLSQWSKLSKIRQDSNFMKNSQHSRTSNNNLSIPNMSLKYIENKSYTSQSAQNLEGIQKNQQQPSTEQQILFQYVKDSTVQNAQQQMVANDSNQQNELSKLSFSDQQVQVELFEQKKAFFQSWRGSNQFIPSDNNNDNISHKTGNIDFGPDNQAPVTVPCGIQPKMINSQLLFEDANGGLRLVTEPLNIKIDKAFEIEEAKNIVEKKQQCKSCKNSSYILYIINIDFPQKAGYNFSKQLRRQMNEGSLNRGFIIAMTGMIELQTKKECLNNGMDYFLGLPLDIMEIDHIMRQLCL